MSATHSVAASHSDAWFALLGAAVAGGLGLAGQWLVSGREDRRLRQRLDHERDQQDLTTLRTQLGDAAEALGAVRKSYVRLMRFRTADSTDPGRRDAEAEQREASTAARGSLDRLRLQFAPDDPLMIAYENAMRTFDEVAELYMRWEITEVERAGERLEAQMAEFATLARARVGPRPGSERPS